MQGLVFRRQPKSSIFIIVGEKQLTQLRRVRNATKLGDFFGRIQLFLRTKERINRIPTSLGVSASYPGDPALFYAASTPSQAPRAASLQRLIVGPSPP
jgi:hypothetical protein